MSEFPQIEVDQVTAEIADQVREWFGSDARITADVPELRKLKRSFFVRYGIEFDGKEKTGLLVKIPRPRNAESLSDALDLQQPRESVRKEYEFLQACSRIFQNGHSKNFFAVRPLSYLPRWNAIAMEELKCRPLKVVDWKSTKLNLVERLSRAAHWLKVFHQEMGESGNEIVTCGHLNSEFQQRFSTLQSSTSVTIEELPRILDLLKPRLSKIENAPLLFGYLHGDFKCSNILVSEEGRIGAIDSKLRGRGPVYADLGKLIANVLSARFNVMSFGLFTQYRECKAAIIKGYFNDRPVNENALDLYCALYILEKWREHEFGLERLAPAGRPLFRFLLRKYLSGQLIQCLR